MTMLFAVALGCAITVFHLRLANASWWANAVHDFWAQVAVCALLALLANHVPAVAQQITS